MSDTNGPLKKTAYVDVDEEITGIIEKIRSPKESIVALVLPKRATMLHSAVNMKLLKRAADQNGKKVVLITSESTLMSIAGAAGLHVAANLQSRPYLPAGPSAPSTTPDSGPIEIGDEEPIDPTTTVGSLIDPKQTASEPIEIDNRPKDPEPAAAASAASAGAAKAAKAAKKDKSKKVPNFNKFRTLLFAGIAALILLLVGGYWALAIAPQATVTLRTESSETLADAQFTADTTVEEIDLEDNVLPAEKREIKKTEIEKVPTTGEKDDGTKATGKVSLQNCTNDPVTVPAGTGISNGELTFITQSSVKLDSVIINGVNQCKSNDKDVKVVAQENGDKYNLSPRTYNVSGYSGVIAEGRQMSGGTSKIIKIVSAADVEAAKKSISSKQNAAVEEIKSSLVEDGYIALIDSFSAGDPAFDVTPPVGSEAAEVIVTGELNYSMLGIKEEDLKKLVEEQAKDKVDTSKQTILDYGFEEATFEISNGGQYTADVNVKTTLLAGPEINQEALKKELAGKKQSEVESLLGSRPGVTEARVDFSPFWVSKVPGKDSKVEFIIEQADGTRITE